MKKTGQIRPVRIYLHTSRARYLPNFMFLQRKHVLKDLSSFDILGNKYNIFQASKIPYKVNVKQISKQTQVHMKLIQISKK